MTQDFWPFFFPQTTSPGLFDYGLEFTKLFDNEISDFGDSWANDFAVAKSDPADLFWLMNTPSIYIL
jgi:hypothetical protein